MASAVSSDTLQSAARSTSRPAPSGRSGAGQTPRRRPAARPARRGDRRQADHRLHRQGVPPAEGQRPGDVALQQSRYQPLPAVADALRRPSPVAQPAAKVLGVDVARSVVPHGQQARGRARGGAGMRMSSISVVIGQRWDAGGQRLEASVWRPASGGQRSPDEIVPPKRPPRVENRVTTQGHRHGQADLYRQSPRPGPVGRRPPVPRCPVLSSRTAATTTRRSR